MRRALFKLACKAKNCSTEGCGLSSFAEERSSEYMLPHNNNDEIKWKCKNWNDGQKIKIKHTLYIEVRFRQLTPLAWPLWQQFGQNLYT
ncbi:hypothetical protein HanIR_Chr12g0597341 [Helianthus annuus]|nr:hypothetical protein HanIR_Chr12g0597341 [Helianthus annuus]